jgi:hypothetical protein
MTSHTIRHPDDRRGRNEAIVQSLVIPFGVVVLDVLPHGAPEVPLTDRNQPVQAFFFNRPYEPFRVRDAFGERTGVRTRRIPASRSRRRTSPLHFRSRSQVKTFGTGTASLSAIVSVRTICYMNSASGCGNE